MGWPDALAPLFLIALLLLVKIAVAYNMRMGRWKGENLDWRTARVTRSGKMSEIPSRELVPGDVVLLTEGRVGRDVYY